jgi:hypothetical protein
MRTQNDKLFYSPQFSKQASVSVRRLAWFKEKPMTATVDLMVQLIRVFLDPAKVCLSCRDNAKCQACIFSKQITEQEKAALLAAF